VLAEFQEVENGLSLTQRLATEAAQQRDASEQGCTGAVHLHDAERTRPGQTI